MAMLAINFKLQRSVGELATVLGCSPMLVELVNRPERLQLYQKHEIPRRNGGHRTVYEPIAGLDTVQKGFARRFEDFARAQNAGYPHPAVHGFTRGSSTKTNAMPHCGSGRLLRLDIRDFFRSISRARVEEMFGALGVPDDVRAYLSGLVTLPDCLVEGLPTSPLISNLVALPLDRVLQEEADKNQAVYTRYADDLSFSTRGKDGCLPALAEIERKLRDLGFELAREKTRESVPGRAHFVTGLSVQMDSRPTPPKGFVRRLRQELYYASRFGLKGHASHLDRPAAQVANSIDGRLNYVLGIERAKWLPIVQDWRALLGREGVYPTYRRSLGRLPSSVVGVVDESVIDVQGSAYFAMAVVEFGAENGGGALAREALRLELHTLSVQLRKLAVEYYADPYASGRKAHLPGDGLHHADDPADLQTRVVEALAGFPMEIFVAYQLHEPRNYAGVYERTLRSILRGRFAARRRDDLVLVFEQNSQISKSRIEKAVSAAQPTDGLPLCNVTVRVESKSGEPLLAVADYALGVFLAQQKGGVDSIYVRRFERLRQRYRYITNLTAGLRFNRRNPIESFSDAFPSAVAGPG